MMHFVGVSLPYQSMFWVTEHEPIGYIDILITIGLVLFLAVGLWASKKRGEK